MASNFLGAGAAQGGELKREFSQPPIYIFRKILFEETSRVEFANLNVYIYH